MQLGGRAEALLLRRVPLIGNERNLLIGLIAAVRLSA